MLQENQYSIIIGQNIRTYRKLRGYTLKQLSAVINCSLSTLAKYESGEITISAPLLMKISECLHIMPSQLLPDFSAANIPLSSPKSSGFFRMYDKYYLFQQSSIYRSFTEHGIITHCMKILRCEESQSRDKIIFYATLIDPEVSDERSHFTYSGYIHYYDYIVIIELENVFNKADVAHIYASVPFASSDEAYGLYIGVPQKYRTPAAGKVVIRPHYAISEDLRKSLDFSDKDTINDLKKTNILLL